MMVLQGILQLHFQFKRVSSILRDDAKNTTDKLSQIYYRK